MHKITRLTLIAATLGWCSLSIPAFAAGNPNNGNNGNANSNGNAGHGNPNNGNNGNTKSNGNAGNSQGNGGGNGNGSGNGNGGGNGASGGNGGGGGSAHGTPAPIAGIGLGALLLLGAGGKALSRRFRGERNSTRS